jgi:hypothetical protein
MPQLKPQKVSAWEESRLTVEQITDGLGKGVDPGIKETVVALMVYGFPTTGSCEGHLEWGLPYPWVEIGEPEPADRQTNEQHKREWVRANLRQQQRLLDLLAAFYRYRDTPFDAQLTLASSGFDEFRMQSLGANVARILEPGEQRRKLAFYQHEMAEFTTFLHERWDRSATL